jgi:hypothetical protein
MASPKKQAIALGGSIRNAFDHDYSDRMSAGEIDEIIKNLRTLRSLMRGCSDIDLALDYLERMKRPCAEKYDLFDKAKSAAVGALATAYNMEERD